MTYTRNKLSARDMQALIILECCDLQNFDGTFGSSQHELREELCSLGFLFDFAILQELFAAGQVELVDTENDYICYRTTAAGRQRSVELDAIACGGGYLWERLVD